MTPQQKAGQLFDKYFNPLRKLTTDINYQTYLLKEQLCKNHAKDCALIAVDEISKIVNLEFPGNCETVDIFLYWQKVKREIEAL